MKQTLFFQLSFIILCTLVLSACIADTYWRNFKLPYGPRYARNDIPEPKDKSTETLRIVSYNIQYGKKIKKAAHILTTDAHLKAADIILLQEIDSDGAASMAETLHMNYVYYPSLIHPMHNREFGNAILSRWKLSHDKKIILAHQTLHQRQRIAVSAQIMVNDLHITIISMHMSLFQRSLFRKGQVSNLLDSISPTDTHAIVGGDFNTFSLISKHMLIEAFEEHHFEWASRSIGSTFTRWFLFKKPFTVDYVFTRGLTPTDAGKIHDHSASDHVPIWVDVEIKSRVASRE